MDTLLQYFYEFTSENWKDLIIFITFIALFFQLRSNQKSIKLSMEGNELTKKVLKKDIQIREIELMPKTHFIIQSQVMLEWYIKDINEIASILEKIKKNPDNSDLIDKISKFHRDKEWLLIKHENKPVWIDEIELSATQYYYNLISCMKSFKTWNSEFNKSFSEDMIIRANDSNYYINKLLDYIKDLVPDVILNCPASVRDSDFYR